MTRNESFDSVEITNEIIDPAGVTHAGELADIGDTGGGGGGGGPTAAQAVVYQSGDTTYAVSDDGTTIDSGTNPSGVIESAVAAAKHTYIKGDYTFNSSVNINDTSGRVIDARASNFTAGGDTKLWVFHNCNNIRLSTGYLDLGTVGRIGLDLQGTWGGHFDVYLKSVPDGTFSANGTTSDRCGIRTTLLDVTTGRGTYWNTIDIQNHWHNERVGTGMVIDGGNSNFFPMCKLMNYDIGINIKDGVGNVFAPLDVSEGRVGVRQREGAFGSHNDCFGMAWIEHCDTGFDVPKTTNQYGNHMNRFHLFGRFSTAGDSGTTAFTDKRSMIILAGYRGWAEWGELEFRNYTA